MSSILATLPELARRRRYAFGAVIRDRRRELGLSQVAFAERSGYERQAINRIENAAYSPSLDCVFGLAEALGWRTADLFAAVDARLDAGGDR